MAETQYQRMKKYQAEHPEAFGKQETATPEEKEVKPISALEKLFPEGMSREEAEAIVNEFSGEDGLRNYIAMRKAVQEAKPQINLQTLLADYYRELHTADKPWKTAQVRAKYRALGLDV